MKSIYNTKISQLLALSPPPPSLQVLGPEALLKLKVKQKRHREGYEDGISSSHK